MHGRSLGALVAAVAIVAAGLAAVPRESAPALEAAPPPAICRAAPAPAGWPEVGASGDVADLSDYQDYRGALGIGDGLRGGGVAIADVEYEWRRTHVELSSLGLPAPPDTGLPAGYQAADHGTAVLGVLGARADGQGVSGLAPDADLRPTSPFATGTYDPAGAVKAAAGGLGPGDVLLIELQALEDGQLVPIESIPAVRTQIRAAVDAGIVVVEPAGNGGIDVGTAGPTWLTGPAAPDHSGALMVGAGGSEFDAAGSTERRRITGSNFGARVDVQGVGAAVVTAGYGEGLGGSDDRSYTSCFDGTSSASATVAGAVAALQSGAISLTGSPLTPAQVRSLLIATGLPQAQPSDGAIGPRPQVDAALASLSGAPPPADDAAPVAPAPVVAPPSAPPVPAVPAVVSRATPIPAATGASAVFRRRAGTLVVRLKGLARGATVTVGARRARLSSGRVTLTGVRPGRIVLTIAPPARSGARYRPVRLVVVIPVTGPPRVVRL